MQEIIIYFNNDPKNGIESIKRIYYQQNKIIFHHDTEPAWIMYYPNKQIKVQYYFNHNKKHHIKLPAYTSYYETGQVKEENYYTSDKLHNMLGPAKVKYDINGNITEQMYFIHGIWYKNEDSFKSIRYSKYELEYQAYLKQESIDIFD